LANFNGGALMTESQNEKIMELTQSAIDKIAELMATRAKGPQAVRVLVHLGGGGRRPERI